MRLVCRIGDAVVGDGALIHDKLAPVDDDRGGTVSLDIVVDRAVGFFGRAVCRQIQITEDSAIQGERPCAADKVGAARELVPVT